MEYPIAVGAFLDHDGNTFVSMISQDGIMWEQYLLKDFKDLVSETAQTTDQMKKIRRIKYFDSHNLYFVTLEGPGDYRDAIDTVTRQLIFYSTNGINFSPITMENEDIAKGSTLTEIVFCEKLNKFMCAEMSGLYSVQEVILNNFYTSRFLTSEDGKNWKYETNNIFGNTNSRTYHIGVKNH